MKGGLFHTKLRKNASFGKHLFLENRHAQLQELDEKDLRLSAFI